MYGKLFVIKVKGIFASQASVYSMGNLEKKAWFFFQEHHIILYYSSEYLYITNNPNLTFGEDDDKD